MEFDVVVVGAWRGSRQQSGSSSSPEITVVVVEKGPEAGAHILSGAVISIGLDKLARLAQRGNPIKTADRRPLLLAVGVARFAPAQPDAAAADEQPRQLRGLARQCCCWLATKAEALGSRFILACRRRGAVRRQRRGRRRRHRRHGRRQGCHQDLFTRGMELGEVHAVRRRRPRQPQQDLLQRFGLPKAASRKSSASG